MVNWANCQLIVEEINGLLWTSSAATEHVQVIAS